MASREAKAPSPTTYVFTEGVPAKPAPAAAVALATVLLHPVGRPSVTSKTAAVRAPACCMVYAVAYWIAPVSAGVVGVLPFGIVAATAATNACEFPGNG